MDDMYSGVQLCLMGKTDALLHRVGQLKEDSRTEVVMEEICEVLEPILCTPLCTPVSSPVIVIVLCLLRNNPSR